MRNVFKYALFLSGALFSVFITFSQKKTIDSLVSLTKTEEPTESNSQFLNNTTRQFFLMQDYSMEEAISREKMAHPRLINFQKLNVFSLFDEAAKNNESGKYDEALKNIREALISLEGMLDQRGVSACYNFIGILLTKQGNYVGALKNFLVALDSDKELEDKYAIAWVYNNIGTVYALFDNYVESLKYNNSALELWKEINDEAGVAVSYSNIANIYIEKGDTSEAIKNYQEAWRIANKIGDKKITAIVQDNMGTIKEAQYNYDEALTDYLTALRIRSQFDDKLGLTYSYMNLGSLHLKLGKFSETREFLNKALILSKQISNKYNIQETYNSLAKLNAIEGKYQAAYENFKMSMQYRDNLINEENTKKIAQLQMKYDFDKKEESLKYEQQITEEKLVRQTLLSQQQQQLFLLKSKELAIANNEKQIQRLSYSKTRAELLDEQNQRKINVNKLIISEQQKALQENKLILLNSQLSLQKKELQTRKTQRNFFIAGTIVLLVLGFFIFLSFQNQKKASQFIKVSAEKKMIELQLQVLRAQLNPHFMFNSLNAIQELIVMEENEKSQSYLERFARLLRILLENTNQPFISLRKEINFIELYLSLEKLRLPDLQYSIQIDPEIDAEMILTPNMVLQPYIENALWHGLQYKKGEKKLELNILIENGTLLFEIKDNGVGRKKAEKLKSPYRKQHRSKGMELLTERFRLLSEELGSEIRVEVTDLIRDEEVQGTQVLIRVPEYSLLVTKTQNLKES